MTLKLKTMKKFEVLLTNTLTTLVKDSNVEIIYKFYVDEITF